MTEQQALRGKWIALEVYTPETMPLRRIEAVGATAADCMKELARRGLDPRSCEFSLVR